MPDKFKVSTLFNATSRAQPPAHSAPCPITKNINFRNIGLAFVSVCLTGCTFFNPTVGMLAPDAIPAHATNNMPRLAAVVNETNSKLKLLESKRSSSLQTNRALGVTTFGLGLAAAGYGLYGSHAHAMKNLAFASGATYVGSSLFTPTAQTDIYHAGIQALSCINDKATRTLYQIVKDIDSLSAIPPLDANILKCAADKRKKGAYAKAYTKAEAAYTKASWAMSNARANDPGLAQTARSASNNVLRVLDGQLISLTPSPDAILNAARSISPAGGMSSSISNQITESFLPDQKRRGPNGQEITVTCTEQELDLANSILVERTANYQAIEKSLAEALNNLDGLSAACVMSEKSVSPITLSQDEVTVTKDIKYVNVVINGGREPYLLTHSDTPGLIINFVQPRTINIITTKDLKTGIQKIEIRDNSTVTIPKVLTIKTP